MGRKKDKRRKLEENRFSSFQSSSDEEENSDAISQKTIKFQVSLKPHGSKIKKPTNFFQGALAEVVKRERICDKFAVKNVTFLKDDMFMVETKGENGQGRPVIDFNFPRTRFTFRFRTRFRFAKISKCINNNVKS